MFYGVNQYILVKRFLPYGTLPNVLKINGNPNIIYLIIQIYSISREGTSGRWAILFINSIYGRP